MEKLSNAEVIAAARYCVKNEEGCFSCPVGEQCRHGEHIVEELARRLEESQQDIDEWVRIFDMLNDRENRHHYLEYWREKNGESDLAYPDGDQIYKDFWEMKAEADRWKFVANKLDKCLDKLADKARAYDELMEEGK